MDKHNALPKNVEEKEYETRTAGRFYQAPCHPEKFTIKISPDNKVSNTNLTSVSGNLLDQDYQYQMVNWPIPSEIIR